ncbi:hypothetical protein IHE44_0011139 [Lamprotornis superbus]|uniref:Uncharacterized protein n=1 Tax=Lamprotornis superbus TaxID=245042 RepID=A0A835NI43_9PASS|nr:hypothetical protein IHE44_0011139 [Lamprotornis superbus]
MGNFFLYDISWNTTGSQQDILETRPCYQVRKLRVALSLALRGAPENLANADLTDNAAAAAAATAVTSPTDDKFRKNRMKRKGEMKKCGEKREEKRREEKRREEKRREEKRREEKRREEKRKEKRREEKRRTEEVKTSFAEKMVNLHPSKFDSRLELQIVRDSSMIKLVIYMMLYTLDTSNIRKFLINAELCYRDNPERLCKTSSRQTWYVCRADLNREATGKTVFPRYASCMGKKRSSFAHDLTAVEQRCIAQMNAIALEISSDRVSQEEKNLVFLCFKSEGSLKIRRPSVHDIFLERQETNKEYNVTDKIIIDHNNIVKMIHKLIFPSLEYDHLTFPAYEFTIKYLDSDAYSIRALVIKREKKSKIRMLFTRSILPLIECPQHQCRNRLRGLENKDSMADKLLADPSLQNKGLGRQQCMEQFQMGMLVLCGAAPDAHASFPAFPASWLDPAGAGAAAPSHCCAQGEGMVPLSTGRMWHQVGWSHDVPDVREKQLYAISIRGYTQKLR